MDRAHGEDMKRVLRSLANTYLPASVARRAKQVGVYPRYWWRTRAARQGFRRYGDQYQHPVLFIAGLPKSGTTWLARMLASYAGFQRILIPEVSDYELRTGGSHDYMLPSDMFYRWQNMLILTKMHVDGSRHNADLLHEANVPYVILYRDLRDVAVSHYFYVRTTRWHPEYAIYRDLTTEQALGVFANRSLCEFADWVRSWHQHHDPSLSLVLRYESMVADTFTTMTGVTRHFALDSSPEVIHNIIDQNSFHRLSGGRQRGQHNPTSFFRAGVVGDWRNHFTDEISELYKSLIGDFLIEYGYETDLNW